MIPSQSRMRYLPRMAAAPVSTPAMTVEEFMDLNPGGDEMWQLVDGEPRAMLQSSVAYGASDKEERWLDDPVLVVKLLTPENHVETWGNIWACTSIPSVEEMPVLHMKRTGANLLRRGADGRRPRDPERLTGSDLVLHSVGLHILLADLYRTTRLRTVAKL